VRGDAGTKNDEGALSATIVKLVGWCMSQANTTTNHDEIQRWAEERGGHPSVVRTQKGKGGILRFDFGEPDDKLETASWEEFFKIFEENHLAFLHQDKTADGKPSRFSKFVERDDKKR